MSEVKERLNEISVAHQQSESKPLAECETKSQQSSEELVVRGPSKRPRLY